MTTNEIIEGNKLIVAFLGGNINNTDFYGDFSKCDYHYSANSLFPVLEKICRLKIGDGKEYVEYSYPRTFGMLNEETGQIMVRLNGMFLHEADTLIEATWLAVVEFIKFWNESKKS